MPVRRRFGTVWRDDNTVVGMEVGRTITTKDGKEWVREDHHQEIYFDCQLKIYDLRKFLEWKGVTIPPGYGVDYDPEDAKRRKKK